MAGNVISEAFVEIRPDTSAFRESLLSTVEVALKELSNLPVNMPLITEAVDRALAGVNFNEALKRWQDAATGAIISVNTLGLRMSEAVQVELQRQETFARGLQALFQSITDTATRGLIEESNLYQRGTGAAGQVLDPATEARLRALQGQGVAVPGLAPSQAQAQTALAGLRSGLESAFSDIPALIVPGLREAGAQIPTIFLPGSREVAQELSADLAALVEGVAAPRIVSSLKGGIVTGAEQAAGEIGAVLTPALDRAARAAFGGLVVPDVTFNARPRIDLTAFEEDTQLLADSLGRAASSALGGMPGLLGGAATDFGARMATVTAGVAAGFTVAADQFGSLLQRSVGAVGGLVADSIRSSSAAIGGALDSTIKAGMQATGLAAGLILADGIRQALSGFSLGSQLEGVRASLTELTGSATVADSAIATLQKTSVQTGQAFQPLADSAKQLTAVLGPGSTGTVIPALSAIADYVTVFAHGTASSAQGIQRATLALQEMGLQGTVQAKFLRQLVNDGVPAYKILVDAATRSGVTLGANDAALLKASTAQDALTKSTLALQTAQQNQATALAAHGIGSAQYANATRAVEAAQINLKDATERAAAATTAADQAITDGHGEVAKALKAGKITADAYFQALSDPQNLGQIQSVIGTLNDNLVFSLNRLKAGLATGAAQLFEPIQKGVAAALSGIVAPMEALIGSDTLATIGEQIAKLLPTAEFERLGDAVGSLLTKINELTGPQVKAGVDELSKLAPVLGALAGGATAMALSFGAGLPLVGGFFVAVNPLLGALAGLALATPQVRTGLLGVAAVLGHDVLDALHQLEPVLKPVTDWLTAVTNGAVPVARALGSDLVEAVKVLEPILSEVVGWLGSKLVAAEGEATAALRGLGPEIDQAGKFIGSAVIYVEQLADDLGRALVDALRTVRPSLDRVPWSDLRDLFDELAGALDKLLPFLIRLGGTVLRDLLNDLGPVVGDLSQFLADVLALSPAVQGLNGGMDPLARTVELLVVAWAGLKGVGFVVDLVLKFGGAVKAAAGPVEEFFGLFAEAPVIGEVAAPLEEAAAATGLFGAAIAGLPVEAVAAVVIGIAALAAALVIVVVRWSEFSRAFGDFFSGLGSLVSRGLAQLQSFWQSFSSQPVYWLSYVVSLFAITWGIKVPELIVRGLISAEPGVAAWLGRQKDAFGTWLQSVGNYFGQLRPYTRNLLADLGNFIVAWFQQAWSTVTNANNWKLLGENVVSGIRDGIVEGIKAKLGVSFWQQVWQGIQDAADKAGIGHSPYAFFNPTGGNIVGGVLDGIAKSQPAALKAMAAFITSLGPAGLALGPSLVGAATRLPTAATVAAGSQPVIIYLTVNVTTPNASAADVAEQIGWHLSRHGVVIR